MYDLIIIGMGISGISAAIYAKRNNLNVLVIEKDTPGGLLNKINTINNYPGYKEITGPDLSFKLFEQFNENNIPYKIEEVLKIEEENEQKLVITKKGQYKCKYIIIATGRVPRKLGIPNEDKFLGKGISTCALCDGNLYKGKDIAIVGGGNSAIEEAIYLSKIVNQVYLIHRKNQFSAEKELVEDLKKCKNINILYNTNITEIIEKEEKITAIRLDNKKQLKIDGLFEYIGYTPGNFFVQDLDICDEDGYIVVDSNFETKINGIYAVGDSIKKKQYQIVLAASDGVMAAISIMNKENKR